MHAPTDGSNLRIWVGSAGTGTAFGLIRSVRDAWGGAVAIVISDTNPRELVAASALADQYQRVPPVSDPAFRSDLAARLNRMQPTVYFPILDDEIVTAAALREAGEIPGIAVRAPSVTVARLCLDKLASARWLVDNGFPTPPTEPADTARWAGNPLIAKPRFGRGSVGVQVVSDAASLAAFSRRSDVVVQPACRPPECTIDAFIGSDGSLRTAVCRERLEVKAGVCTKARLFRDIGLETLALEIGIGLNLRGTYCVQVMRDARNERYLVTDINPRPGAGSRMSSAAGTDLLAANVADALGWPVEKYLDEFKRERYVVRQYTEFIVPPDADSA